MSKVGLPCGAFDDLELTGVLAVVLSSVKVGLPGRAFDDSELSGLSRMGSGSGSGRTGARSGGFSSWGILAGALEVAPAVLGLEMVIFFYGAH